VSEELIAEALYPYPKDLVIATKGGLTRPSAPAWERDARPGHLRRALATDALPQRAGARSARAIDGRAIGVHCGNEREGRRGGRIREVARRPGGTAIP